MLQQPEVKRHYYGDKLEIWTLGLLIKDNNLFAVVSYLHTAFSHLCIDPLCILKCWACCSDWTVFYLLMSWGQFPVNTVRFVPLTYPTVCVREGLCFWYMWSRSGSNPHITFTLRNVTQLLGSKLLQSGSFDSHWIHLVNVGSNPLILCSHYTGKWFWCRVDLTSLRQKVLMWLRP